VSGFYNAVSQHDWSSAVSYWTPAMQGRCPPQTCINSRFAGTTALNLTITGVSRRGNTATVGIDLLETRADGSTTHWTGSWYLVQGQSEWLLNSVDLSQAGAAGALPPAAPRGGSADKGGHGKHKGDGGDDNGNANGNGNG
jgi:hypothetical protein